LLLLLGAGGCHIVGAEAEINIEWLEWKAVCENEVIVTLSCTHLHHLFMLDLGRKEGGINVSFTSLTPQKRRVTQET